jgi:UDP-N-acetylmuramoyl-tripeptide--D-alanyl-D-alanine ligase
MKINPANKLLRYLRKELPEISPSDKFIIPYLSFWTRLVLQIKKPVIIGVTGTAGKTTVTQMLGHVLMQEAARPYVGVVGKTSGNLNGDYGVRLSILRKSSYPYNIMKRLRLVLSLPLHAVRQALSSQYPRLLVLEYGTYAAGHVQDLVNFATPQIAILTNIGPAHLERHKTVEGVYIEKRALVKGAPRNGLVVLGSGHEFVSRLEKDAKAPVVVVDGRGLTLAQNIARVVCRHLGLPEKIIDEGLNSFTLPKSRLNRLEVAGMTIIDDSFNANPLSMKLGLDTLAQEGLGSGRRVAMLGVMRELGELSPQYHREIGLYARERADLIIGVGEGAQDYAPDLWFLTSSECAENLESLVQRGDMVFIKGSHFAKMGVIVNKFKSHIK